MSTLSSSPLPPSAPSSAASSGRLAGIAKRFAANPRLWRPEIRFTAPDRWYQRLERTAEHEVWLLTWLPGQGTEIHDHGGSAGAFHVVDGELTERAFPSREEARTRLLRTGGLRSFGPRYIHEVTNRGTKPAASIHVYAPALSSQTFYRQDADGRLTTHRTEAVAH